MTIDVIAITLATGGTFLKFYYDARTIEKLRDEVADLKLGPKRAALFCPTCKQNVSVTSCLVEKVEANWQ
jgi:hypothetical protein